MSNNVECIFNVLLRHPCESEDLPYTNNMGEVIKRESREFKRNLKRLLQLFLVLLAGFLLFTFYLNRSSIRYHRVFRNDNNSFADKKSSLFVVVILDIVPIYKLDVFPDARVFIDDRVLDPGILPDPNSGFAHHFILQDRMMRFVIIASHQDDAVEFTPCPHDAADAHNGMADIGRIDDAAVRNNSVINLGTIDF